MESCNSNLKNICSFEAAKTLVPWLLDDVSIYIKLLPIGGNDSAPEYTVGLLFFVDFKKFCILPLFF